MVHSCESACVAAAKALDASCAVCISSLAACRDVLTCEQHAARVWRRRLDHGAVERSLRVEPPPPLARQLLLLNGSGRSSRAPLIAPATGAA
eukprot:6021717-Pleurochrysis_carterae.AAC.1